MHQVRRGAAGERHLRDRSSPFTRNRHRGSIREDNPGAGRSALDDRDDRVAAVFHARAQQPGNGVGGAGDTGRLQPIGKPGRLAPCLLSRQPDDVEDVQQVSVHVEIAEMILADEIDEGRSCA